MTSPSTGHTSHAAYESAGKNFRGLRHWTQTQCTLPESHNTTPVPKPSTHARAQLRFNIPLGFPWAQLRSPPWQGPGLPRCHWEHWTGASCSPRMMTTWLGGSPDQTLPLLKQGRETNSRNLAKQMPTAGFFQAWNAALAWLICFPAVCDSSVSVVWSPNRSKVGEGNRIVIMGWRGAWQAAGVGGVRRLAGWCRVI